MASRNKVNILSFIVRSNQQLKKHEDGVLVDTDTVNFMKCACFLAKLLNAVLFFMFSNLQYQTHLRPTELFALNLLNRC